MEQEYSKDLIYGNFLTVENEDPDKGGFPDDCETLAMLQSNIRKVMMLGRICGYEYLILSGCEKVGTQRTEGYVYAKGEILYHKAQIASDYCYIEETYQNVTANNETYNKAYSLRTLTDGQPDGAIPWSEFKKMNEVSNIAILKALDDEITKGRPEALKAKVDYSTFASFKGQTEATINQMQKYLVPKGTIVMWSGSIATIPDGWALCDGNEGRPNLKDKFIIGAGNKYTVGTNSGTSKDGSVKLTPSNIPEIINNRFYGGNGKGWTNSSGPHSPSLSQELSVTGSYNCSWKNGEADTCGRIYRVKAGQSNPTAVDIMPPYYALAFIIKL